MRLAFIIALVTLACSPEPTPTRAGNQTASTATAQSPVPDSTAVHVHGPTLISFYPTVTQAQIDSSEELATVLDDFSYHRSTAQDSLRAMGFTIVDRPPGTVRIDGASGSRDIALAPDSADVGFVLVAPDRRDRVMYGVMTGSELIDAGHKFLAGVPIR